MGLYILFYLFSLYGENFGDVFLLRIVVPTIENGDQLSIRVCFSFFHTQSGTTNNHWKGSSEVPN